MRKRREDYGSGFWMVILNAPVVRVMGEWYMDVDWNVVEETVFRALAEKPARLTGNEVRFIRKHRRVTLEAFAERFAVTRPVVLKWERAKDAPTVMAWATERDIRLAVLDWSRCPAPEFKRAYETLAQPPKKPPRTLKYDARIRSRRDYPNHKLVFRRTYGNGNFP
jgi:transcriptional regulator with XRE-family HTH domain